jgi:hypothetical protein
LLEFYSRLTIKSVAGAFMNLPAAGIVSLRNCRNSINVRLEMMLLCHFGISRPYSIVSTVFVPEVDTSQVSKIFSLLSGRCLVMYICGDGQFAPLMLQ